MRRLHRRRRRRPPALHRQRELPKTEPDFSARRKRKAAGFQDSPSATELSLRLLNNTKTRHSEGGVCCGAPKLVIPRAGFAAVHQNLAFRGRGLLRCIKTCHSEGRVCCGASKLVIPRAGFARGICFFLDCRRTFGISAISNQEAKRQSSAPLYCHPDRSGPIFSFAPLFGASGRGAEGSAFPLLLRESLGSLRLLVPSCEGCAIFWICSYARSSPFA